jgi:two-component system, response regulator PdtaR
MKPRILIVEDEMLIALDMEAAITDLGFEAVGIASDAKSAIRLASTKPDIALVDLHLRDGLTGIHIGERLSVDYGVTVVFVTANPRILDGGVNGTLGVVEKPFNDAEMLSVIEFALGHRKGAAFAPPHCLRAFAS